MSNEQKKETNGTIYGTECPLCEMHIENMCDGDDLTAGDIITCPHCGGNCEVTSVDVTVSVTLTPCAAYATCAACGEIKELCGSLRVNGIQQPRICKTCLIAGADDGGINNAYWIKQMEELVDVQSLDEINRQMEDEQHEQ